MQENIELEQLAVPAVAAAEAEQPGRGGRRAVPQHPVEDLRRLSEVPVEVTVEIGRTRMTVGEALGLHPGSIVALQRTSGEPVDLLVNGTLLARGEVVVIDEQFGLRVTQVIGHDDHSPAASAEAAAKAGGSPAA